MGSNVKKFLLKIAGKDSLKIDDRIGFRYVFFICLKYGVMIIRGLFISLLYKNIKFPFFVGSKCVLVEKRKMRIGAKVKIHNNTKIDALSSDGVVLGESCVLGERCIIECTGSLSFLGKGLKIGNRTSFGRNCFFGAAGGIEIGDDVIAGQNIRFHSENHFFSDLNRLIKDQGVSHKGIVVGNNCWIGAGAIFLDGATIGNGCVVAANAVVRGTFGDNCVIGGVPAKVLKMRSAQSV